MTKVKFTKMQGLGNDFILFDTKEFEKINMPQAELAVKLCDRHFGIGADGIFVVNHNPSQGDIGWLFLQSDGSTSQMCGNGMRCFAKYVYDKGYVSKKQFAVETLAGLIKPEILDNGSVKVNMSKPILEPAKIPFKGEYNLNYEIECQDKKFIVNAVSMGNPHCIIYSDRDTRTEALTYGAGLEKHAIFPEKTNVEFVKIISRQEINVDVWERGCGITLACGTGACASAVASILNGYCDNRVKVNLPGGSLTIDWAGNSQNTDFDVFMTGDAQYVFEGEILL